MHAPKTVYAIQQAVNLSRRPLSELRNAANLCADCGRQLQKRKRLGYIGGRLACLSCAITREVHRA